MLNDRRLKLKEIVARVGLTVMTVFRLIYDKFHIAKASARWVPHRVTCSLKFQELSHGKEKNSAGVDCHWG